MLSFQEPVCLILRKLSRSVIAFDLLWGRADEPSREDCDAGRRVSQSLSLLQHCTCTDDITGHKTTGLRSTTSGGTGAQVSAIHVCSKLQ